MPDMVDRGSTARAPTTGGENGVDNRRLLVERIAASPLINRSARLRELLVYLCDRVLEGGVPQIREHEVGHRVFGRPPDYDTTSDNIVRVHAWQLRKRLAEYFATEGAGEPIVIEIPKGNYAPVFRERTAAPASGVPEGVSRAAWPRWVLAGAAVFFACATLILLLQREGPTRPPVNADAAAHPTVHLLWSQIFQGGRPTDIVLDDATIGLYQDLTKRPIALNDYYDRSYLRNLPEPGESGKLDREAASSVIIRRHSSYAAIAPLWKLFQIAQSEHGQASVQFARDYSFHALKANNVILLGTSQTNPWVEPFDSRLGIRWVYDPKLESFYPIDTWAAPQDRGRFHPTPQGGEIREGYCAVALLSNLGATGTVLLISATGGSAITACGDFLGDEQAVSSLRQRLGGASDRRFPYFEALLGVKGRSTLPRDVAILLCRPPRV